MRRWLSVRATRLRQCCGFLSLAALSAGDIAAEPNCTAAIERTADIAFVLNGGWSSRGATHSMPPFARSAMRCVPRSEHAASSGSRRVAAQVAAA
jgi:hypothetical protein